MSCLNRPLDIMAATVAYHVSDALERSKRRAFAVGDPVKLGTCVSVPSPSQWAGRGRPPMPEGEYRSVAVIDRDEIVQFARFRPNGSSSRFMDPAKAGRCLAEQILTHRRKGLVVTGRPEIGLISDNEHADACYEGVYVRVYEVYNIQTDTVKRAARVVYGVALKGEWRRKGLKS